jgi:hypothetical protein
VCVIRGVEVAGFAGASSAAADVKAVERSA